MMTTRKLALLFTALATITTTAIACSGGGGGGGGANGELTTGIYDLNDTNVTVDECGILDNFQDGAEFTVIVSSGNISLLGLDGAYDAGSFDIELVEELDLNGQGLDCVLEGTFTLPGQATSNNVFAATLGQNYTVTSGAACGDLGITFPCTSTVEFVGKRLRDLPPPPFPITGVITTAHGFLALSTLTGATTGTDLYFQSTFGIAPGATVTDSSESWTCYLPDPPSFPNYEIFGGFNADLYIFVEPASWSTGAKLINGTTVGVNVGYADGSRSGDATGGTLNITSAPTTTNGLCGFTMGNVPLAGEQDPAATAFAPTPKRTTLKAGGIAPKPQRRRISPR